jgi:hypothetical protein
MRILYDNKVFGATITPSSEVSGYPISTALTDTRLSRYGKLNNKTSNIVFDLGAAYALTQLCIMAHNFTANAVIKIQASPAGTFADLTVNDTVTSSTTILHTITTAAACRYWRLTIDDTGNDTPQLAFVHLGTYLQLPGMKIDQEFLDNTETKYKYSPGQQLYADIGADSIEFTINYPYISTAQRDAIRAMFALVSVHTPVVAVIWPDNLAMQAPIYCHMTQRPRWKRNESTTKPWATSISFKEVR